MNITTGATLSGGSTVTLTPAGIQPGKSTFVGPGHTILTPVTVDYTFTAPKTTSTNPGTSRTGLKVSFASRTETEGCCTVQDGAVIIDLGVRWSLNQPTTEVDDAIAYLRGLVYTTAFVDAVKKGVLPQA